MLFLTLIAGMVLLPKGDALRCYECIPGASGTCTETTVQCPLQGLQCASMRVISYAGGSKISDVKGKSCALAEECVEGSLNFGISKTVLNTKCCTTDLCNTQPAPEPSKPQPNGRKCFTCLGEDCTHTLSCDGNEDRCISATVNAGGQKTTVKGCASNLFCTNAQAAKKFGVSETEISCCQGDLCNSASSTSAGLLLLVAPLMSLVLFS